MLNVLHGLFNGAIIPWERNNPDSKQQIELCRKLDLEERHFREILSPEEFKRFEAFRGLLMELSQTNEQDTFAYGFSLGLLSMLEVMQQGEQMAR